MCKYLRVISIKDSIPPRESTLAVLPVLYYYFTFYKKKKNSRRFDRNRMEKCCADTGLLKTNLPGIFPKKKKKQVLPVTTDFPNGKIIY